DWPISLAEMLRCSLLSLTTPCRHSPAPSSSPPCSQKPGQTPSCLKAHCRYGTLAASADRLSPPGAQSPAAHSRTMSMRSIEKIAADKSNHPDPCRRDLCLAA